MPPVSPTVNMEDVDLGKDRTNLIDFIYGKRDPAESVSPSVNTPALSVNSEKPISPKKIKERKEKKPSSRVSCSTCACFVLLLLTIAAILFAAFLGHHLTKQNNEMMAVGNETAPLVACKNITRTHTKQYRPIIHEEDNDEQDAINEPTVEQLALPKSIQPLSYQVSMSPNGTGIATVTMNITEDTNTIVLNSKDIQISEGIQLLKPISNRVRRDVESGSGEEPEEEVAEEKEEDSGIKVKSVNIDENLEKVTLVLDGTLKAGSQIVAKIPFASKGSSNTNGLREYKMNNKSIFTTQPSYAYMRHVFPSFDQESFKAPAGLTLTHQNGTVVVANTEVKTHMDGDQLVSTLDKTIDPDFVIGDLVSAETNTSSGVTIRVWTRPEVQQNAHLVLEYADKALDELEHILQSRLETQKLDIIGVPNFQPGNRVSRGFIVLPEEDILYNDKSNSVTQKVRLVRTLANKIAGQWFGGITNPEEYGTFWLNDALPRFLEIEAVERVLNIPSDDLWTLELEEVLEKDAASTARPLRVKKVHSSAGIASIDHEFLGEKGAVLLRMIEKSIGMNDFIKGIRNFVSSYRSSYPNDDGLLKSLEKAINKKIVGWDDEPLDISKVVKTWVDQIGFPLVSVSKLDEENLEISQNKFYNDNETPGDVEFKNAKYWFNWEVPLFIAPEDKNVSWLHETIRFPLNQSDTILLNSESSGIYRVNYEQTRWNKLAEQLSDNFAQFKPEGRARLLSDSFALANSGIIPFEVALNLTTYISKETHNLPWIIAARNFADLVRKLEDSPLQDKLNAWIYSKVSDKFEKLSADSDDYLSSLLYEQLIELLSSIKPLKSNHQLNQIFQSKFLEPCQNSSYSSQCSTVPAHLRDEVYCNGVEFGDDDILEQITQFADAEIDGQEKDSLVDSLACFRDPRVLRRIIQQNLNSTSRTVQLLRNMNTRPVGREVATNWILDNWRDLKKKFKDDPESLNQIVDAGIAVDNERERSTLETFINQHHKSTHPLISKLDRKIEGATSDIYWRKSRNSEISDYLNGKFKGPEKEQVKDEDSEEM
ncbi:unnamed protein product [Caenorhabditis angaria]|uniref:Aminopeptidase n=1 Tax=Caenorhabditis angaria TaxID=860376 RepID=A0A9P1N7D4_9PELO|nr:unnamed protein product [Caenorhabditis angaria]